MEISLMPCMEMHSMHPSISSCRLPANRILYVCLAPMQGEMPKRAVTWAEFFNRFPPLHSYLLGQLGDAAQGVQGATSHMHPSLYPILVLLSRLRHSTQAASNTGVPCSSSDYTSW